MPAPTKSDQAKRDQPRTVRSAVDLRDQRPSIEVLSPPPPRPAWTPAPTTSVQAPRTVRPGVDLLDSRRSIQGFQPLSLSVGYLTAVWAGAAAWAATQAAGAIVTQAVLRANPAWLRVAAEVVRSARDG